MTSIFISNTQKDAECAEQIRLGLEAQSYSVWRAPSTLTLDSLLYPRTIENVILGSSAVILVWSSNAAHSDWVERHIFFAQRLKKLIFPIVLDGTNLPNTLVGVTPLTSQVPCMDVVASILAQPNFPPPQGSDALIKLSEQAAHEFIRVRKEAIDQAAEMLKRNEHREALLAILEYLAHNDLMMGVRDKAQEVLDTDARKDVPPQVPPDESRHIFGVRCKNGHVSYFDKRQVCSAYREVPRDIKQSAGQELDELHLKCNNCGVEVVARIDCRGYK